MARKAKKKVVEEQPPSTEEESVQDDGDVEMDSEEDAIPDIVDQDSGDEEDGNDDADDAMEVDETNTKKSNQNDKKSKSNKESKSTKKKNKAEQKVAQAIPFMDTFYQLSSDESPKDRAIAARDLLHHCFLTDQGINHKDAAYALTRLMNGLCTGRAASRQGFASCLTSFMRIAYSTEGGSMEDVLKEDEDYGKKQLLDAGVGIGSTHPAMIVRQKLLLTTQFLTPEEEESSNAKGNNKMKKGGYNKQQKFGGKMKGIEERDHVFGRLFGILAVVRSGVLSSEDFPSDVSIYNL